MAISVPSNNVVTLTERRQAPDETYIMMAMADVHAQGRLVETPPELGPPSKDTPSRE